jgi:hypothetical protein
MAEIISIADLHGMRLRRRQREEFEAKREQQHREASERLHRLLYGDDWPPSGGHAA